MNRVMKRIAIFPFLFLCLVSLVAGCGSDGAYPKKKGSLRIVQYNIGAFSKEIENSIPMVAAMMKELHADAISLNELDSCNARHTNNQVADFAAEHPEGVYIAATGSHAVCIKNGNIIDNWDSSDETVTYYFER